MNDYTARKARLAAALREGGGAVRLGKSTSNLFRDRKHLAGARLDVRDFCRLGQHNLARASAALHGTAST